MTYGDGLIVVELISFAFLCFNRLEVGYEWLGCEL